MRDSSRIACADSAQMLFCTASTPSCCKTNLQIADAHQSSTSTLALPRRSTSLLINSRTAFFSVVAEHIQPYEARRVRRLFNLVCQIVEPFNLGNHVIHCHQLAPPRLIPVRRALPARFPFTPRTVPRRWRRKSRRAAWFLDAKRPLPRGFRGCGLRSVYTICECIIA